MFKRFTMFQEKLIERTQLSLEDVFNFSEKRKFMPASWQEKIGYQQRKRKIRLALDFSLT